MGTATKERAANGAVTPTDLAQSTTTPGISMAAGDILDAHAALEQIAQTRIPFAAAMAVRRALRAVGAAADDVKAERQKLIEAMAQRDDADQIIWDRQTGAIEFGDNRATYADAARELLETEIELDMAPIPASILDLGNVEPAILFALGDLLLDDL